MRHEVRQRRQFIPTALYHDREPCEAKKEAKCADESELASGEFMERTKQARILTTALQRHNGENY